MYVPSVADTPIPDRIHMTGANTNIKRTITPCIESTSINIT